MSLGKRTKRADVLKERGDVLWRERAKERVISSASLNASKAALGKDRRATGTLKEEISWMSQRSSPPGAHAIMSL